MNLTKRLALIGISLLLLLCTACGGNTSSSSGAPPAPSSAGPQPVTSEAPKENAAAPAADPITLKIGYGGAEEMTGPSYIGKWAAAVTEATDGRINFEIYPSGQLGTLVEMIEACDLGTLDITFNDPSLMQTYLPEIGLLSLPCIIQDYNHMDKVFNGPVGDEMIKRLSEVSNLHVMGWVWNGFRCICSTKPLNNLADCENLIIRSPESDIYIDTFKLFGMSPTPLPLNDVYTAMQTDVVQAVDSPIENFVVLSFGEIGKYVLESNHLASSMTVVINQNVWNSISDADQKTMQVLYEQYFTECNQKVIAAEQSYKDTLVNDMGVTLTQLSDRDALLERFKTYWTDFASKNNCQDLLDMVLETM